VIDQRNTIEHFAKNKRVLFEKEISELIENLNEGKKTDWSLYP
jgi:hypothetical protein